MGVMISSMKGMTRTMQEIQQKSESLKGAHGVGRGNGKAKARTLGIAPQMATALLFESYKIPVSGFVSGFEAFSKALRELRRTSAAAEGTVVTEAAGEFREEIIPLDENETAMEQRALLPETTDASFGPALWEIGRAGRSDYAGKWTATFDYPVGQDRDPVNSPSMPHLLSVRDGTQSDGATDRLNIHFTLDRGYEAGELALTYDRWGGEKDQVCVDDTVLAPIRGAGRGRFRRVSLLLEAISAGSHIVSFTTSGDTEDKEHRIDYLRLAGVGPRTPAE